MTYDLIAPPLEAKTTLSDLLLALAARTDRDRVSIQDLLLGWAVSTSQFLNARRWMWLQQARKGGDATAPPVWAPRSRAPWTPAKCWEWPATAQRNLASHTS